MQYICGRSRISQRGNQPRDGGANLLFWRFFPKIAWNWKKLDPEGVHVPSAPLDPLIKTNK